MKTIKLPESEILEMKQFYQEEYDRLARRLQHIRIILGHLGIEIEKNDSAELKPQTISIRSEESSSTTVIKRKKKAGRKSKWELLIMKRLRQLGKPVTYDELTDEIMTFAKLPESKRTSTKQAVVNVIFRLRNRDKKLDTFSVGTREKYIALKSWFEKPGEIKKEYAAKIAKPTSKKKSKTSRRRGRPRKEVPGA